MLEVERNVEIPEAIGGRTPKYPFKDMDVGDSFFAVVESNDHEEKRKKAVSILASARPPRHGKRRFTTRIMKSGVRCWRTE